MVFTLHILLEVGDLSEVSGSYQGAGHQGRQHAREGGIPAELRDTRSREVPHQERTQHDWLG